LSGDSFFGKTVTGCSVFRACLDLRPHRLICAYTRENRKMAQAPTFDTEINKAPALRISHIVRGRVNDGSRVRYLVDSEGNSEERAIPEDVVLLRWRRRTMNGHTFHGCRLGPNTWRAIGYAFGSDAERICCLSVEQIAAGRQELGLEKDSHHFWLPDPSTVACLFEALGTNRLAQILNRHLSPERVDKFGTPDLFLFSKKRPEGKMAFFRLVEVKKPHERISLDQHEEIAFLRSIGVPARVLRLIERN
jgi:hypothetical protein